jgi:hypothetical protein
MTAKAWTAWVCCSSVGAVLAGAFAWAKAAPCAPDKSSAAAANAILFILNLPADLVGDAAAFLQDGMDVTLEMWDEKPISVALPDQVEATIVEADAVVRGQTASSSFKPALLDNGVRVMVPPHIESGTRIVVDVYERTYVGKAG